VIIQNQQAKNAILADTINAMLLQKAQANDTNTVFLTMGIRISGNISKQIKV